MIINTIIFLATGIISLLLLTIIVYKTGMVHNTRDSSGHLKKQQSVVGLIIMITVFILIILFFILYQLLSFNHDSSYLDIFSWSFLLMMLLVLFDSFFIDLLLIGIIRPRFLNIPVETTFKTMVQHVKKTFIIGWLFIIPIVLISTTISFFIL
jgi:hypothetical protein